MTSVQVYANAQELPNAWDVPAAENPFLMRRNLQVLERVNPCQQQYYLAEDGHQSSIAISYQHHLNVLAFTKSMKLHIPVTMIGVPLSISVPGYVMQGTSAHQLRQHLNSLPGLKLALNASSSHDWDAWHNGQTLPSCQLTITDGGMTEGINTMRSSYRRRIQQAQQKWADVTPQKLSTEQFDREDYSLYQAVWQRSPYKLECMPITFFQQFPATIIRFSAGNRRLGFIQVLPHHDILYFMLGGMDYELRDKFDTYWNLLLAVIQEASTTGCRLVELGQTAESVKRRLGAKLTPRYLFVHHRARSLHALLRPATKCLAYQPSKETYRVYKH